MPRSLIVGGHLVKPRPGFVWTGLDIEAGWGCGGALIHPDIVMTAAHCQWVYRGVYIQPDFVNGSDATYINVKEVLPHPLWNHPLHIHDIMIAKLDKPTNATLFKYNKDPTFPVDGDNITIAGFGTMSEDGGVLSSILREVSVNVQSFELCQETWHDILPVDQDLHLCSGTVEGGKDACNSDSGSPIFFDDTVVAIVVDGIGCGRPNIPSLNTRVSAHADWIHSAICALSVQPPKSCFTTVVATMEGGDIPSEANSIVGGIALPELQSSNSFHMVVDDSLILVALLAVTLLGVMAKFARQSKRREYEALSIEV